MLTASPRFTGFGATQPFKALLRHVLENLSDLTNGWFWQWIACGSIGKDKGL
jgi:hypothetical protein